jgi:protein-tyrosine phosphatase
MEPWIKWVDAPELNGRVAIIRRPRGGKFLNRDLASLRDRGITTIVSLLADVEIQDLELDRAADACRAAGITFVWLPIDDFGVPASATAAREAIEQIAAIVQGGSAAGFHCYASRGRSPTVAACVLVKMGLSSDDAVQRLSAARGHVVPETETQRQWIAKFEQELKRGPKPP